MSAQQQLMTKAEIAATLGRTIHSVHNMIMRIKIKSEGTAKTESGSLRKLYDLQTFTGLLELRKQSTLEPKRKAAAIMRKAYRERAEAQFLSFPQTVRLLRKKGYTAGRIARHLHVPIVAVWPLVEHQEAGT